MGATNPIPNYLELEPKAIRKVDCHQCPFSFVSGEVQYGTANLSAIFHYLHPPYYPTLHCPTLNFLSVLGTLKISNFLVAILDGSFTLQISLSIL